MSIFRAATLTHEYYSGPLADIVWSWMKLLQTDGQDNYTEGQLACLKAACLIYRNANDNGRVL